MIQIRMKSDNTSKLVEVVWYSKLLTEQHRLWVDLERVLWN
jgi:hypothetical protein